MSRILDAYRFALSLIADGHANDPQAVAKAALAQEATQVPREKQIAWEPPEWVPKAPWIAFMAHRKSFRNVPFTDAAKNGVINKLQEHGKNPREWTLLLETAVERGWRTVFPLDKQQPTYGQPTLVAFSQAAERTQEYLALERLTPAQRESNRLKAQELRRKA